MGSLVRAALVAIVLSSVGVSFAPSFALAQPVGADEEARRLFSEGRTAYDEGRYEDALRAFRRAYVMSNRHALLYNIGQTALRMGHDAEALESFEAYLRQASADDPHRAEVEERVRVLRTMVPQGPSTATTATTTTTATETTTETTTEAATETAATTTAAETTTTTATTTEAPPPSGGPSPVPWIIAGGGAAIAIAGGVLLGVASGDAASVNNAADGSTWAMLQPIADRAQTLWTAGEVLLPIGLVVLAGGVVWGVVDLTSSGSSDGEREAQASARVRVGLGSIAIEGSF